MIWYVIGALAIFLFGWGCGYEYFRATHVIWSPPDPTRDAEFGEE